MSTLTLHLVGFSCSQAAEFTPLGYGISTNLFGIRKASVSEDGRVVALSTLDDELVRWTPATGSEVILDEVSGASVSGGGSTIVTSRILAREPNRLSRGVKVIGDRVEDLSLPVGESYSTAEMISRDGSAIVGSVFKPNFGGNLVRWTDEGAEALPLRWSAVAVSQDGAVVVDTFNRWTAETGAVELPDFQRTGEHAIGASSNGRWTVGRAATLGAFDRRGVRYDGVSDPKSIDPFDQDWGAAPLDITNDGSLIVGRLYDPSFGDATTKRLLSTGLLWTSRRYEGGCFGDWSHRRWQP